MRENDLQQSAILHKEEGYVVSPKKEQNLGTLQVMRSTAIPMVR